MFYNIIVYGYKKCNHSLITMQRMRLNELSPCKIFGMLQNKHRVPWKHLKSQMSPETFDPYPPPFKAGNAGIYHPPWSPTCLHSNHFSPLNLQRKSWCSLVWITSNVTEKSVLIAVTFQLFFQSFAEILSEAFREIFKCTTTLWRLWQWTCILKCCWSSQD